MNFNTNDLGYKLISGQLQENRKHSEQLNKYVAGFFDADGWVTLQHRKYKKFNYINLQSGIKQAFSVDKDASVLRAFQSFYGLGKIYYSLSTHANRASTASWLLSTKDTHKLFTIIGKHLRVKGTHFRNLCEIQRKHSGQSLTVELVEEYKVISKISRLSSKWLKHPKHPSWAWVAGFIDGDGHYSCRLNRKRVRKNYTRGTGISYENSLRVAICTHNRDMHILKFLKKAFKGNISPISGKDSSIWQLSLGKQSEAFSLRFLKNVRKHCCLKYKYDTINKMIKFHEDNRSQRLSKQESKD